MVFTSLIPPVPPFFGLIRGIWAGSAGDLVLVALQFERAPAPGLITFSGLFPTLINASGQVAFGNGPGGNSDIFAGNPGSLAPVVLGGEILEVAPGDLRQARFVRLSGYNDGGHVAFTSTFSDVPGVGIFVTKDLTTRDHLEDLIDDVNALGLRDPSLIEPGPIHVGRFDDQRRCQPNCYT